MLSFSQVVVARPQPNYSIKLQSPQSHPSHHHSCSCDMCGEYEAKVLKQMLANRSQLIRSKLIEKQERDRLSSWPFEFILKRLLLPHHKIITQGLGVFIPEICFYKDGEADCLYTNVEGNDKIGSFVGWQRKEPCIIRIKKEKLTNTQIQKIFNEKRRKYREKVGSSFKRKLSRKMSQYGKKESPPQTKDAVIVKYLDGYEQLKTENDFIGLTLKRKQDPYFKKIDFIKNFIGVSDEDKKMIYLKYERKSCKYEHLFERAEVLMKIYGTNIQEGDARFISGEEEIKFSEKLLKESVDALAHYTLYKIVAFIEYFYDEKITVLSVKFLLNELSELYLLHVYHLEREELVKYSWTHDTYMKKVAQAENKLLQKKINYDDMDEKMMERSTMIQGEMRNQYEMLKFAMGLSHVEKNNLEEQANNRFFSMLHPQLATPISEVFRDKTMTVTKFQEKYLGYKHRKKSVAQSFNSNLVRNLHKMTPPLKVAKGHEIEDAAFPRTPSINTRTAKRSFSVGNTISTANKTMTLFL